MSEFLFFDARHAHGRLQLPRLAGVALHLLDFVRDCPRSRRRIAPAARAPAADPETAVDDRTKLPAAGL